jgi:hypothetical protein
VVVEGEPILSRIASVSIVLLALLLTGPLGVKAQVPTVDLAEVVDGDEFCEWLLDPSQRVVFDSKAQRKAWRKSMRQATGWCQLRLHEMKLDALDLMDKDDCNVDCSTATTLPERGRLPIPEPVVTALLATAKDTGGDIVFSGPTPDRFSQTVYDYQYGLDFVVEEPYATDPFGRPIEGPQWEETCSNLQSAYERNRGKGWRDNLIERQCRGWR